MILDQRQVTTLARRGLMALQVRAGTRIDCTQGRIWITEDGCTTDIVLEAGDSFDAPRSRSILVQALVEAVISVREPAVQRRLSRHAQDGSMEPPVSHGRRRSEVRPSCA